MATRTRTRSSAGFALADARCKGVGQAWITRLEAEIFADAPAVGLHVEIACALRAGAIGRLRENGVDGAGAASGCAAAPAFSAGVLPHAMPQSSPAIGANDRTHASILRDLHSALLALVFMAHPRQNLG